MYDLRVCNDKKNPQKVTSGQITGQKVAPANTFLWENFVIFPVLFELAHC
jgi:hypothetical protein